MNPLTATAPTAGVTPAVTTWDFDLAHSNIGFVVRHLVISKVHGRFSRWSGSLEWNETRPEASRVEVHIETASIDTNNAQRDEHLRSADFFDAANHPEIVFRGSALERDGADYRVRGDLTISGVTKPIVLEVESLGTTKDPWGGRRAGYSVRTAIDRRDFGLVWNQVLETGGVAVGDKVEITIEIEAVQRMAHPASL